MIEFTVGEAVLVGENATRATVLATKPDDVKVRFESGRELWFPPSMMKHATDTH